LRCWCPYYLAFQIACLVSLVFCFASVSSFPYCESCIAKPFFLLAAFYIQI
jgi:hypothetical protein